MDTEMTLRPMVTEEQMYSYSQSQQLISQCGCIGHLRVDFGSSGEQFFSTWDDHRKDLKSEDFKHELDDVINALREDTQYGGILKNRDSLSLVCKQTPESSFGNDREYGFRADTSHYSYLLRLNPNKGEYNIYCYCYLRQWLDRHMHRAEKGIRFITPQYKDLFRITDGDAVRYFTREGEMREIVCRYIDDYHFETESYRGGNLYHICEFAERYESQGCNGIIPLRKSLPEKCFSHLETSGEIIVITKGERGYSPTGAFPVKDDPKESASALNDANGITKAQEAAMVAGSMFGWDTPAADPKNYDENGLPVRSKPKECEHER